MWSDPLGRVFIILAVIVIFLSMMIGYGIAGLFDEPAEITCWVEYSVLRCRG